MKKLFVFALFVSFSVFMLTGVSFAGQAKDNCGCGLGTVLFADRADDSVLLQILQATTNSTFGNQTFGITSGTLDCEKPVKIAASDQLIKFVYANMDNLAKDIAAGSGESLDTLAELMEINENDFDKFSATLKTNFDFIFDSGTENVATVLDRIVVVTS